MIERQGIITKWVVASVGVLLLASLDGVYSQDTGDSDSGRGTAPSNGKSQVVADKDPDAAPQRTLDLSSPRGTMRTFLVAVQDALKDKPERIDDAVACVSFSELDDEGRLKDAPKLAKRLGVIIDRLGVNLEDITDHPDNDRFVFFPRQTETRLASDDPVIAIARDGESGQWLFTANTVASIPAIEQQLDEQKTAKPEKPVEGNAKKNVPAARRSPRATMETFLNAANAGQWDVAFDCLDPTGQSKDAWNVVGRRAAEKLKYVIDRTRYAVLSEIPDDVQGEAYTYVVDAAGNIVLNAIDDGELAGEWRFTPETILALDSLYAKYENAPLVKELQEAGATEELSYALRVEQAIPKSLKQEFLYLAGWLWLALIALIPFGLLVRFLTAGFVMLIVRSWLRTQKVRIDIAVQKRALRSSGTVLMILFWQLVIEQMPLPAGLLSVLLPIIKFALVIAAVWFGYRLVDILGGYIAANRELRLTQFDDVLVPLLRTILRMVVVLIVVLFVLERLGQKPTTVLGALGIGGVALAFAAQDTIGNFFGSITVLLDRPFGIGDWIVIGNIEGTVERVGFRSTRVRTFYNSMVTIPNAQMVNTNVDNYGARRFRRVRINIGVTYDTLPEKIDAFCEGIRELIRLHPSTRKDYYHVYFNGFSDSSLNILLYAFFEVPDWGTELRERHRLFVDIIKLARRLEIEFAFPTRTVWFERGAGAKQDRSFATAGNGGGNPNELGVDEAAKVFEEYYGTSTPRLEPVVIQQSPVSRRREDSPA